MQFKSSFFLVHEPCLFQESFETLRKRLEELDRQLSQSVKRILVGNKCDLIFDRVVGRETAQVCERSPK